MILHYGWCRDLACEWVSVEDDPDWVTLVHRIGVEGVKAVKRRQSVPPDSIQYAANPQPDEEHWPLLVHFLTDLTYSDPPGPRQTGTLLLFAQDGVYKVFLRDRDAGEFLAVAGPSMRDAFDVAEEALGDENAVWRKDRNVPGQAQANRVKR